MTNFIEEQRREAGNFDSSELERLIKGHCRGELDSVRIHDFVRQVKTNTLNHILESGLLEEKPVSKVELLPEDGHNDLARAIKAHLDELIKLNSV